MNFQNIRKGRRSAAALTVSDLTGFVIRFFRRGLPLFLPAAQCAAGADSGGDADDRQQHQPCPAVGQCNENILHGIREGAPATGQGAADALTEALRDVFGIGLLIDLLQIDGDRGERHL